MPSSYRKYNEYCTFILDLSEGPEKIFTSRMHKKTRNAIRKAIKLGLEIDKDLPSVETYWRFYEETMMRSKGLLEEKRIRMFRIIWRLLKFREDFITLTAIFNGKPIGGVIAFLFRDKVHLWYNSSLTQFLHLNPNQFLYWKLIEEAYKKGYRFLDFGPTPLRTSEGHYRFKARFGGKIIPFNDYIYFNHKLRCLLIERGLIQMAKKVGVRRMVPYFVLKRIGGKVIL